MTSRADRPGPPRRPAPGFRQVRAETHPRPARATAASDRCAPRPTADPPPPAHHTPGTDARPVEHQHTHPLPTRIANAPDCHPIRVAMPDNRNQLSGPPSSFAAMRRSTRGPSRFFRGTTTPCGLAPSGLRNRLRGRVLPPGLPAIAPTSVLSRAASVVEASAEEDILGDHFDSPKDGGL